MKFINMTMASLIGIGLGAMDAQAETWPAKPLRAIVAAGPGSTIDIIPRVVFEELSKQLGQAIIVENRGGAGGTIAANAVAKADGDGYSILVHSNAHTIAPSLYPKLGYRPAQDFSAVISLGILPAVLVVPPDRGWKTLSDFVAAARARPGSMNFSSVGAGSATHLSAEQFRARTGVQAVHVPFKGGGEAMTEVIAGRIDFFFGPVGLVASNVRQGKLIALAVNGTKRSAALPEVPTTSEAGVTDAEYPFWIGLFLPSKTPRDIVRKLHSETHKALQSPLVRDKLAAMGVEPLTMSPQELDARVVTEIAGNAELVKAIGLKTNQ